jgi:hypothetical protein
MFPIVDLANLRVALVRVQSKEIVLYGFLLYTDLDTVLVEYVKLGFDELDVLAGPECVIFVVEAPSSEWVEIARRKKSPWLGFVKELSPVSSALPKGPAGVPAVSTGSAPTAKQEAFSRLLTFLAQNPELCLVKVSDEEQTDARHLLDPQYQLPYNRFEALDVARFFGVKLDEVPCLILFESLEASRVWALKLGEIQTVQQAKVYFRKAFASADFDRILVHARTYDQTA